jgi:PAS domain S-box-containing protein
MVLKKEIAGKIKDLLKKNPQGLSITDIVKEIKINRNTAGRYLENLLISGQVEMRRFGMAKIYVISKRIPLSAVLSMSSDSIVLLDSSLRIIFANEPFLNLVGTDSKNLLGKNIEYTPVIQIFDESFAEFIEAIWRGISGNEWSGEIELRSKGIIILCRIAPTVYEDGRRGASIILEDITQWKQTERALLESDAKLRSIAENSPDIILILLPSIRHSNRILTKFVVNRYTIFYPENSMLQPLPLLTMSLKPANRQNLLPNIILRRKKCYIMNQRSVLSSRRVRLRH